MIRFSCPTCKCVLQAPAVQAGEKVACPNCGQRILIPNPVKPAAGNKTMLGEPLPVPNEAILGSPEPEISVVPDRKTIDDDETEYVPGETKYCHECGRKIRARAEICPKCGVRQHYLTYDLDRPREGCSGIKVPVLISAISNIVVGLFWASTGCGIGFTILMILLCIREFQLWSQADDLSPRQLRKWAKNLGIFEIVVGLFNTPTLICGIIVLINSGKLADQYEKTRR